MENVTGNRPDTPVYRVNWEGDSIDSAQAAFFCAALTALGLALATYKYFRNNAGSLKRFLRKIRLATLPKKQSKIKISAEAREERAVNAVVCDPIPSGKFLSVYKQRRQTKQLAIEFKALARNQEDHTTNAALRNVLLNIKQEVVPYDHSRVIVWDRPETVGTDYYNASFIDGYNGPKEYIASQGPSTKCLVSFWHLVWQEGVTCVVMATGLFENAVQQCDKYWVDHTRKHTKHGHIHIWHERSTYLAQLNIRTFRIQKEGSCESRVLTHYEMVGFHDECPDPGLLLDVRRRVNSLSITQPGPVLVHCRCGGGRTAVYVAVDFCLHQLQSEDRVDVYSSVLHLRRFRKNMVRTLSQYKQIYNAVAMYLQCGVTVYPADTLLASYQVHYAHGGDSKHHRLEKEFQTLQSIVPRLSIGDCASGHRVENRSKSRDIMMLPPECARPYLTTADCGDSGTDFINAVYVDGYHVENSFLVTQWPMKRTVADLWRLMFDFKITSLVFMNDPHKFSRSYPRFWPKEIDQVACYGPISVRYLACERKTNIVIRTFAIRKPKRHTHLVAQALMRISEDVMTMNSLVGCEIRQDEVIVKMFQLVSPGGRNDESGHLTHGDSPRRESAHNRGRGEGGGGGGGDRGGGYHRSVGILSKSLLTVMEHVADWQKRTSTRQPICIISKDGSSRVGVYCAVAVCCDQVRVEREVDVFNAVRLVRKNRPQLVPNLEEYRYIYHFMTEFILLSGSKPDIIVSEPPSDVLPYLGKSRSPTSPTALPSSVHGGVYVVATGKGSEVLTPSNRGDNSKQTEDELQTRFDAFAKKDSDYLCISHPGRYHDASKQNGGLAASGTKVPCRVDGSNGMPFHSADGTQKELTSPTCSGCSKLHALAGQTPSSNHLINGQILSSSTLQPLGDIHHSSSDTSITRPSPQPQILSPTGLSPLPLSTSPLLPTPFLTPEMSYRNGKFHGGLTLTPTSLSLSPSSYGDSSSFLSCTSHQSLTSNNPGTGSSPHHIGNGGIPSSDLINGILHRPASVNGNLHKAVSRPDTLGLNSNHSGYNGLSSPSPPSGGDMGNTNANETSSNYEDIKLIHASYMSLDDSLSGSLDGRDHYSSLDWVEQDDENKRGKRGQGKTDRRLSSSHMKSVLNHSSEAQHVNGGDADMTSDSMKKRITSFSLRQKIKGCRHKLRMKKLNPNPNPN